MRTCCLAPVSVLLAGALALPAQAEIGKLPLTGGVSSIDGAAGGGLTPWAMAGTQATAGQWGLSAFATALSTQGHRLQAGGLALGWNERLEISLAQQRFDTGDTGAALGLPGLVLSQHIVGAKWQIAGDAILDSDRWMPAVAVGLLAKRLDAGGLAPTLAVLGARRSGTDLYVSATKLLLEPGLLLNATLRATRANQGGLLGFGSAARHRHTLQPEFSAAWLLRRNLALGAEYRFKPDHLNPSALGAGLAEDDWADVFIAWAPHAQLSLTAAWVDLGRIVPAVDARRQRGAYLSLQAAF
ncbi:MAG: DUF3034 family protein [Burkholderiaceae bacterium]|nr:DUF3034 family protein [Burkholderiaceae bacterium]